MERYKIDALKQTAIHVLACKRDYEAETGGSTPYLQELRETFHAAAVTEAPDLATGVVNLASDLKAKEAENKALSERLQKCEMALDEVWKMQPELKGEMPRDLRRCKAIAARALGKVVNGMPVILDESMPEDGWRIEQGGKP